MATLNSSAIPSAPRSGVSSNSVYTRPLTPGTRSLMGQQPLTSPRTSAAQTPAKMTLDTYLNHPTFGLLYQLCEVDDGFVFATLYAQRLFFHVVPASDKSGFRFQPVNRGDVKAMLESRMRTLRRSGTTDAFVKVQKTYQSMF